MYRFPGTPIGTGRNRSSAVGRLRGKMDAMKPRARSLSLTIAVLIAFWLIWSRLNFVVFVSASFWQILLVFAVLAVVIFLGLDHLFNRSRD